MSKIRILVIEDDPAIRRGVVLGLGFNGYAPVEAPDAATARAQVQSGELDLVLLDLNLPDGDGLDLLEAFRASHPRLPIIILTARGEEGDRVKGLRAGADDYVVKPFGALELLARIEAVLRRCPARPEPLREVSIPGGCLDLARRELRFEDGAVTPLSEREAELLTYLAANPGRAISRDELLARVWHLNPEAVETRTVDMHMVRLREKLRDDGGAPRIIRTVRGRGYAFEPEVTA